MSKFIKEGAYGCVYRPGVNGDGKPTSSKYISKIQYNRDRTEQEPEIGKRLREKIPYYENYFAPALETCPAKIASIKKSELTKCNALSKPNQLETARSSREFVSIKIKYIGSDTLEENLNKHMKKSPTTFMEHMVDTHIYLANAVEELVKQQIIHHDIKENNIIYSKSKHAPILIDFGVAFQLNQLYKEDALRSVFFSKHTNYPPWCPETFCIASIIEKRNWEQRKIKSSELKEHMDIYFNENPIVNSELGDDEKKKYKQQWMVFLEPMNGVQGKRVVEMWLKHWNTWDMYSVNVMYYTFMYKFKLETRSEAYRTYLKSQIFGVPSKRDDPEATYKRLTKMVKESRSR